MYVYVHTHIYKNMKMCLTEPTHRSLMVPYMATKRYVMQIRSFAHSSILSHDRKNTYSVIGGKFSARKQAATIFRLALWCCFI